MRKKLNTSLKTNPLYWKRVKDQLEAYNTKVSSIALRQKLIDDQKRMNYSNEMANIRGVLARKRLPFQTIDRLKTRHEELKRLGGTEAFAIA
jgi:hypothetical protein